MSDQVREHEAEESGKAASEGLAARQSERDAAKSAGGDQEHTNHTPPGRFGADDLSQSMDGRNDEERGEIF